MERVTPVENVPNVATPQLRKPRANRTVASAEFLRAEAVPPFMLRKSSMKVELSKTSLMLASSIQNLDNTTGISLLV